MTPREATALRDLRDRFEDVEALIRSVESQAIHGRRGDWLSLQIAVERLSDAARDCRIALEEELPSGEDAPREGGTT